MKICVIDPGRFKSGIAILDYNKNVIFKEVIATSDILKEVLNLSKSYDVNKIILGGGTAKKIIFNLIKSYFTVDFIDEKFSTLEARNRYWNENPPKGWLRFIPRGLLTPPVSYDDYAAVILGERYLDTVAKTR